jgi:hypothetical protein
MLGVSSIGVVQQRKVRMDTSMWATLAGSRLVFGIVTVVGMGMCSAGIGKAAQLGLWVHPVSIAGYLLGALALLLAAHGIFPFQLVPLSNPQALLAILAIVVVKIILARLYSA